LRLLLDEHYSPKIAAALRERGHGVVSVRERSDLRGLNDLERWRYASAERRALVTENVAHFMPLVHEAASAGERHSGIMFLAPLAGAADADDRPLRRNAGWIPPSARLSTPLSAGCTGSLRRDRALRAFTLVACPTMR
jgi:hypothetical protein